MLRAGPERTIHGLNDEVDVCGSVRPEAHVYLLGIAQTQHDARRIPNKRAELSGFGFVEIGNVNDVAFRLDDKRSEPEWTYAVLNEPMVGAVNQSARAWTASPRQVTRDATVNVVHQNSLPRGHR